MKVTDEELGTLNRLVQAAGLAAEEAEAAAATARIADSRKNREMLRLRAQYGSEGDINLVTGEFVEQPPQASPPSPPKPMSDAAKLRARGKR